MTMMYTHSCLNRPSLVHTVIRVCILITIILLFSQSDLNAQQREIEVSSFYAKVYVAPSTNANFVGLIQKGERYPIITVRDNWYNIRFKNVNGWISFSQAKVIDPQAEAAAKAAIEAAAPESTDVVEGDEAEKTLVETTATTTEVSSGASENAIARSRPSASPSTTRRTPRASSTPQTSHTPSVPSASRQSEKKESKIRSWFTQQNVPELPPVVNPNADREARILFFRINFPSGVRKYLDPGAPILGMTKRGQTLQLIGQGDSWCKVVFADSIGWVETKTGKIIDPAAPPPLDFVKIGILAGVVIVILTVFLMVLLRFRRLPKMPADDSNNVKKRVLIISRGSKTIQYTLTNGTTSLDRCFSEVGFEVTHVKEGALIKSRLQEDVPDVIMIDYQFDHSIIPFMEKVCKSIEITEKVLVVTFNVPDPRDMQPGKVLSSMLFLGTSFSDRDVFKIITPMLRDSRSLSETGDNNKLIQKSSHTSALAGNIGDGNLLEVLQFIEIGSKTGCLLVEIEKPFAIICFKNGRINFAATADKIVGRDAIFKVLELKKGKFRFVLDKKPKTSNVNLTTLEVLMEWTKKIDEANVN